MPNPLERSHRFTLYVSGLTRRSERATANLRRLCAERLGEGSYEITVVDVTVEPERAEADRVVATPTVIRTQPMPRRRVIGDLSMPVQAAHALELPAPLSAVPDEREHLDR